MRQVAADTARILAIAKLARAAQVTRQRRRHATDNQSAQHAHGDDLHYLPDPNRLLTDILRIPEPQRTVMAGFLGIQPRPRE
jgi:hypothetical protein